MDKLTKYLDTILPPVEPKKPVSNPCCRIKRNRKYDGDSFWYVCIECGLILSFVKEVAEYQKNVSFIVKTFIPMTYKTRHLVRLQKWSNYDYYEIRDNNLVKFIDALPIENREVKNIAKVIFLQEFRKVKTRAKVKRGLICYAIYKSHLIFKQDIDLDDWFDILDIKVKHYNNAVKKIKYNKLFYPKNINIYLKMIDNKINKNYLIELYNTLIQQYKKYNTKTILTSLIYFVLKTKGILDEKTFFAKFNIDIKVIREVISNIIIDKDLCDSDSD